MGEGGERGKKREREKREKREGDYQISNCEKKNKDQDIQLGKHEIYKNKNIKIISFIKYM